MERSIIMMSLFLMFDVLKIIYKFENHSALTSEIDNIWNLKNSMW